MHLFLALICALSLSPLCACDKQPLSKPAQPKEYEAKVRAFATMTYAHPKTIECLRQTLSSFLLPVLIDIVQQSTFRPYPFLPARSLPPALCCERSLTKKIPLCYIFQPADKCLSITRMQIQESSAVYEYPKNWDSNTQQYFAEMFTQHYGPCSPREHYLYKGNSLIQPICGMDPRVLAELAYLLRLPAQKIAINSAAYEQGIYESPYMLYPDFTLHDFAHQIQSAWIALKGSHQPLNGVLQKIATEFIQAYESSQFIQLALETQPGIESVLLSPKVKED